MRLFAGTMGHVSVLLTLLVVCAAGSHVHDGSKLSSRPTPARVRLFPSLTRLSHGIVEFIFGRPTAKVDSAASQFRQNLVAKYANDVVLRFNLTTIEDEQAMSDAAYRLFLDVWAFTKDYVDVRIHKDDVASLLSLLPARLHESYSPLISDMAEAVYSTYPSAHLLKDYLGPQTDDSMDLATSIAQGDNVFFRDYQPLPVRAP